MCAAVTLMLCYKVGETVGNCDICCSWRYGFLQNGGDMGKF